MRRRLAYLLVTLAAAALAAGGLLALYLRPLPVELAPVEARTPVEVYGLGTIEARILSKIGFEVGNTLDELCVDHGDRVAKGEVLARLHQAEPAARLAEAQARFAQAEAELGRARARVIQAEAELAQKRQVDRRRRTLAGKAVVAPEAAEAARTEAEVAAAELAVAQSEVAVAQAALADARARQRLEEVMLAHHTLTAPYDALVIERHRERGAVLAPGEPVFTLVDPRTVWVLAYVDEAQAGRLAVGQPAAIRLRSQAGSSFPGHVARIGIENDRAGEERRVYVAFDEPPAAFHLGEQAEVLITTDRLQHAALVPETAVAGLDGAQGVVWTVEDGRLWQREVAFGQRTLDGRLEIAAGLPAGARVVERLVSGLREGRPARAAGEAAS